MKINRIIVPEYKNVSVDLELHSDLITLLVGQNGMGKSNLLEVLLLIFDELNQLASGRRPSEDEKKRLDYTLEYECRGHSYKVVKQMGVVTLWEPDSLFDERFEFMHTKIPFEALPSQIIGYYSGENKRIRDLVAKHIKSDESSKRRRYSKGTIGEFEPKRLFFAENRHAMIVLATLLLYQYHPIYGSNIKTVLCDIIKIDGWDRIHITFCNPTFANSKMANLKKQNKLLKDYLDLLMQGEDLEEANIFWGIKGNVDMLLRLLLEYYIGTNKYSVHPADRGPKEYFDIESIPSSEDFRTLLFERFPSPMEFLHTLEECYVLNIIDTFEIVLRKAGEKSYYPYKQLSEGEQQYLTVIGLIALSQSGQDETLFLLDEPDTHINPLWQRNYIAQLENLVQDKEKRHFFISTHSPLLVQAYNQRLVDLLLFKKGGDGKVYISKEDYTIKNWRIDQVLLSGYFDLPSARSSELDEFMQRRLNIIRGIGTDEDREYVASRDVGLGYLPTGETIDEIEAMAYIHAEAKKLREKNNEVSES